MRTTSLKIIILVLITLFNAYFFQLRSQTKSESINLNVKDATIEEVFKKIESQTGFSFFYDENEINIKEKISINVKGKNIDEVLNLILEKKQIGYAIKKNHIVLYKKKVESSKVNSSKPQSSNYNRRVTGTVIDEKGAPMIGVTVAVKWTTNGVTTGLNGNFDIEVPYANATLEFSYLGYKKTNVELEGKTALKVTMQEETTLLTEAVVIGYGTQKKLSVTGSVTSASVKSLQSISTPFLSNTLGGSMSGIVTRQASGEPGNDASQIFIRGIGTWVNRNPLTLVDGVERDINIVNSQEIESITMLKDASATAVYGVRGANGVILITTKRGSEGKPKVELRTENAVLSALRLPEYIDGYQYANLINEALLYAGKDPRYTDSELEKFKTGSNPYFYPNINWVDKVLKKNTFQTVNNLSITGGSPFVKYFVNIGYTNQMGIYKEDPSVGYKTNADATRYNFRSNIDIKVAKNLDFSMGLGGIIQKNYYPGVSADRIFNAMKIISPIDYPVNNPDGSIAAGSSYLADNPWGLATHSGYSRHDKNTIQGTFNGKWDLSNLITKGLSLKGTFSYDHFTFMNNTRYKEFETKKYLGMDADNVQQYNVTREEQPMLYSVSQDINRSIYLEAAANYERAFDVQNVSALFLFNRREYVNLGTTDARLNLPYRSQGLAGRLTYTFDNRYLFEFNFGYNGSENFPKGKRYGFFPSASAGWIVSGEKFWKNFANISYFKIRGSIGQVGNDQIGGNRFLYESLYNTSGYTAWFGDSQTVYPVINEAQIGNQNISWEVATKSNIGADVNLFKDKVRIQVDGFYENRKGILLKRQGTTPEFSGIYPDAIPYANLGKVTNKGIDAMIEYNDKSGDFFYSVRGTFTFARNKVIYNDEATPKYSYQSGIGKRIDQPFGLIALGYFKDQNDIDNSPKQTFMSVIKPGDVKYLDVNKDGVVDDYDKVAIGYARTPEIVFGLGGTFGYKNIECSVFFNGVKNSSIFFEGSSIYPFSKGLGSFNILKEYYDNRWTPDNPNAKYPAVSEMDNPNNNQRSTLNLRDASYIRLKSAEIAYRIPAKITKLCKIENARIFINGINLLTFDKIKIINPESDSGTGGYPLQKSVNFGLQIGF